jgi:hypothetical protein
MYQQLTCSLQQHYIKCIDLSKQNIKDIPSSPTLKASILKGWDPLYPCCGGAPGLKKLEILEPTSQTGTTPSRETVTS